MSGLRASPYGYTNAATGAGRAGTKRLYVPFIASWRMST